MPLTWNEQSLMSESGAETFCQGDGWTHLHLLQDGGLAVVCEGMEESALFPAVKGLLLSAMRRMRRETKVTSGLLPVSQRSHHQPS